MCGIAGIVRLTPDASIALDELRLMTTPLAHRGPDDEGHYLDPLGRCGLGFRRLSIIDLVTGHQPLADPTGRIHVVFNGEIYNFRALRAELEQRGCQFRTRSDTEVIVHAYATWGTGCFARLAGMFAIGLWDARDQHDGSNAREGDDPDARAGNDGGGRLILARDRLGKKPLIYAQHAGRLLFASEQKAILALPGVPRDIDPQALHRYLMFQYVPAPHAVFRGFAKVPPGHWLEVSAGRVGPATPFWQVPAPAPFAGSYAGAQQRLDELLTRAVERRLIADVPLGAFLSGGVDSSIIVALMRRLGVSPLRTFSIGFPDARYDETAHARAVARHCDTEHHEYRVTPAAAEVLPLLAYHYDEPFADSSAIPTYYVARETRRHVTVALTGDGGDECFAGYDRYRAAELAARGDVLPAPLRRALARVAEFLPHGQPKSVTRRLYRFLAALGDDAVGRYLAWVGVFPPALLAAGYSPEFRARLEFDEPQEWFAGLYAGNPPRAGAQARVADGLSAPACAAFADLQSYLPYDLLTKVDIASMACSLECRAPFLDHELVEFALSLPIGWRLGKRIVKDWARPLLPPGIVDRPKMGFGVPVGEWFRGELRGLLHERVLAPDGLCGRIFCRSWLERLLGEHDSGRDDHTHRLWALLMLELWHERWQGTL